MKVFPWNFMVCSCCSCWVVEFSMVTHTTEIVCGTEYTSFFIRATQFYLWLSSCTWDYSNHFELEDGRRAEKILSFVAKVLVECKLSWQLPTVYASEYLLVVIATWKLLKKEGRKDNYSLHIMSGLIYQDRKSFLKIDFQKLNQD